MSEIIVKCKDCIYYEQDYYTGRPLNHGRCVYFSENYDIYPKLPYRFEDDFCSEAVKKGDKNAI